MQTENVSPVGPWLAGFTRIQFVGKFLNFAELTDVDPASVKIGDRVEMTFRRLYTQDGIHNYFWKARPLGGGAERS